jgi:hypothetical protein
MDRNKLTAYEIKALDEITQWREEREGIITKVSKAIDRPVDWIASRVPARIGDLISKSLMGFIEMLYDTSKWTFPKESIIKKAQRLGATVSSISDLQSYELERLDKIARGHFVSHKIISTLTGAGCGLGGFALIAVDVPVLFLTSFRAIQMIGSSYGFDMDDPTMLPIVLSVFSAGTAASSVAKAAALADMRVAVIALSKNWTFKKVAEKTQTGVLITLLREQMKSLPKEITQNLTKRKLTQTVPIAGSVVGAGFNYWFMSNTTKAAYMIFRYMYLEKKYGSGAGDDSTLTNIPLNHED